jgi:hypothetical protein
MVIDEGDIAYVPAKFTEFSKTGEPLKKSGISLISTQANQI